MRMILSTCDDGEVMVVHTPRSRVVTIVRNDPQKGGMNTKRLGVKLIRWKVFSTNLERIIAQTEDIQDGKSMDIEQHMGGGVYITMSSAYPFMQFREYYKDDEGNPKPGRKGIRITFEELAEMKCHIKVFNEGIQGFQDLVPCYLVEGHDEKVCRECNFK